MKRSKTFGILSTASVLLIVAGFLVPPTGVIDPSVLTAVGEIFAFAALAQVPIMLESGHKVRINKGDTTIELHDSTPTPDDGGTNEDSN